MQAALEAARPTVENASAVVPPFASGELDAALETLRERYKKLQEQVAALHAIGKELEQVRQAIWSLEQLIGAGESTPAEDGRPIWEHVQNLLLSNNNEPMSIPEIMLGLDARRNVRIEGKTPSESVRTILIRKPDIFERLEGGKFKIK
jgi:hypothetical protein